MTVRNATELVVRVSNTLGWAPPITDTRPLWKVRSAEAGKLSRAIRKNPELYTWDNLELAVAFMQRKRVTPRTPLAVLSYVEPALAEAYIPDERPLGEKVEEAITWERARELPGWEQWVLRFSRAFGAFREEIYNEWREVRGRP